MARRPSISPRNACEARNATGLRIAKPGWTNRTSQPDASERNVAANVPPTNAAFSRLGPGTKTVEVRQDEEDHRHHGEVPVRRLDHRAERPRRLEGLLGARGSTPRRSTGESPILEKYIPKFETQRPVRKTNVPQSVRRMSGLFWKPPCSMYFIVSSLRRRGRRVRAAASSARTRRTAAAMARVVSVAPVTCASARPTKSPSSCALPFHPLQPAAARQVVLGLAEGEDVDAPDAPVGRDDDHQDLARRPHDVAVEVGRAEVARPSGPKRRVARHDRRLDRRLCRLPRRLELLRARGTTSRGRRAPAAGRPARAPAPASRRRRRPPRPEGARRARGRPAPAARRRAPGLTPGSEEVRERDIPLRDARVRGVRCSPASRP